LETVERQMSDRLTQLNGSNCANCQVNGLHVRVCGLWLSLAASVCIDLAVHKMQPSAVEKGEDFALAAGDKLDESPTDSGSSTSPSDNTSEDSAPPPEVEMSCLLHPHSSAAELLSNPVLPPRTITTG